MLGTTLLPLPRCHYPFTTAAILKKTDGWNRQNQRKKSTMCSPHRAARHIQGRHRAGQQGAAFKMASEPRDPAQLHLYSLKSLLQHRKRENSLNIFGKGKNIFWKTVRTAHLLLQQDCYWIQKTRGSLQGGVYVLPRRNCRVFRLQNRSGRCSTQCPLGA